MEISKYRMMSGIRSHRPNPIHRNTVALGQAQTQPTPGCSTSTLTFLPT